MPRLQAMKAWLHDANIFFVSGNTKIFDYKDFRLDFCEVVYY
jgi:hypothetical protein